MRKRVSARCRFIRENPGVASDYLCHIDSMPPDLSLAVIYVRVSKGDNKQHLLRYEEFLRDLVRNHGHKILCVISEVAGGQVNESTMHWRKKLIQAIEIARENPAAYVIACSMCRFIRHPDMHKHNQGAQPACVDFECLKGWANGVPLVTAWHPDLSWKEVKSRQAKLFFNGKGGRPKSKLPGETKKRTLLNRSKVFWLHGVVGLSFKQIAAFLNVQKNQVFRWWRQLH